MQTVLPAHVHDQVELSVAVEVASEEDVEMRIVDEVRHAVDLLRDSPVVQSDHRLLEKLVPGLDAQLVTLSLQCERGVMVRVERAAILLGHIHWSRGESRDVAKDVTRPCRSGRRVQQFLEPLVTDIFEGCRPKEAARLAVQTEPPRRNPRRLLSKVKAASRLPDERPRRTP